jgi:hypothetical protein
MMWIPSISYEIDSAHFHGFIRNPISQYVDSKHFLEIDSAHFHGFIRNPFSQHLDTNHFLGY